jgi:polar amino acid transport system substrate-binding protein
LQLILPIATAIQIVPKPFVLAFLSGIFALTTPSIAAAETVMEKIARTGVLTAGTNNDAMPFAYKDNQGRLIGYSVDMLGLIRTQIEAELGKKIQLRLVTIAPNERIAKIKTRQVDIICDFSSFTWERDRQVDFSMSYAATGTHLLVKNTSKLDGNSTLRGKRIGVIAGTTNEIASKRAQPQAKYFYVRNWTEGYQAVERGLIDAFAADGVLLEARLTALKKADSFTLTPSRPYSKEGIACMVPENNSRFLNTVNLALFRHMQSFVRGEAPSVALFDRWFGTKGVVPLNRDLRDLVVETMRLVADSYEETPK